MVKNIHFPSDDLALEARIDQRDGTEGVVVTHPHPLYGGSMDNHVVDAVCMAYARKGFTTLRFNFRGAGRSQGSYDEGRGEQNDVRAAVAYLQDQGMVQIDLAGYSFGAWINALAITEGLQANRLVMVSPPVAFIDFAGIGALPGLHLVVTGSRDEFAPVAQIRQQMPLWNPTSVLEVIEGCDHFYSDCGPDLADTITRHIAET